MEGKSGRIRTDDEGREGHRRKYHQRTRPKTKGEQQCGPEQLHHWTLLSKGGVKDGAQTHDQKDVDTEQDAGKVVLIVLVMPCFSVACLSVAEGSIGIAAGD